MFTNLESTLSASNGILHALEVTIRQSGIPLPLPISFDSWPRHLHGEIELPYYWVGIDWLIKGRYPSTHT